MGSSRAGWAGRMIPWLVIGMAAVALAACSSDQLLTTYLAANQDALRRPAASTAHPMQFVVQPGSTARTIAENLQNAGLIGDARLFEAYVRAYGLANKLQAGKYTLSPHMTPIEIAAVLQHAMAPSIPITIPEGWRLEQTADHLTDSGILDGEEYRTLATDPDWRPPAPSAVDGQSPSPTAGTDPYEFLNGRPLNAGLEGYLFPDTYQVPAENPNAADLLRRQLDHFGSQVVPLYQAAEAEGATSLLLHEVLTLASIVDREAVIDDERPMIAGVYLNRLKAGMKLDADPTVQYAMGYQPGTGQWWKTPVSLEEYAHVDSPYNTYLHVGLPPGPIASPGIKSIRAVLYPAKHDYLYFVALPDGSGRHAFSGTYEEHLKNVRRFQEQ